MESNEAGEQSALAPIEIERLKNIARNEQLLFDLGIIQYIESAHCPSSVSFSAVQVPKVKAKKFFLATDRAPTERQHILKEHRLRREERERKLHLR